MKSNKLLIIDLKKNLDLEKLNYDYIKLSSGSVKLKNSNQILIKKYLDKYYETYKKKLINNLKNKIRKNRSKFLIECEVFNLRNDKEIFINKLIVILIIKKFILKKKNNIEIITDDYFSFKVFKKLNLDVNYFGKEKNFFNFSFLKILKFYLKTLIVLFFNKHSQKKISCKNYENLYLSLYPNFYKKNKELFFTKKKELKINFLLTDETHMNFRLKDLKNILLNFNEKNTINIESFIHPLDIFKLIVLLPINMCKFYSFDRKLIIDDCDFSDFFRNYINKSLINRFKLEIYEKSLVRLYQKFPNIKNFHYYMFEYSFGFFLTRLFKENFRNIKLIGYQHGIFSDNIMWLDLIKSNKKYLPHKIIALNKLCARDYKYKIKDNIVFLKNKEKKLFFPIQIKKNKKNKVIVFTGTHDALDIYNLVLNNTKKNKNTYYYLKFHPRIKFKFIGNRFLKKITKLNNQSFSKILISQTSTLVYDFIKFKQKFNTISCDYRPNLTSSKLKNYELNL